MGGGFSENAPTVTISSNVITVNLTTQNTVPFMFNANITTTTLSNIPASGKYCSILWLPTYNGSSFTWAWLTSTVKWPGGAAPVFTNTNAKVDAFVTFTIDGGTTWRGIIVGQNYA
jgi:hypothetical protein